MKFSAITLLAAATTAVAQLPPTAGFDAITHPTEGEVLTAGGSYEIIWEPAGLAGTVTINLIQGPSSSDLSPGGLVVAGVNNLDGKYNWTNIPDAKYAAYGFNLTSDQDPLKYQLSFGFHIKGDGASSSPTTSASSGGYPTSKPTPSYTSTITLSQGPSYSQYITSSSAPVSTYKPTYPASNSTWTPPASSQPAGTGYPTTPVAPATSSGPTSTPSTPVQPGSAVRFGASGLAAVAGLVLAFAL